MLEMRPSCECCNGDLAADSEEAMICSFECTFCRSCAELRLAGCCPSCGGELVRRPRRPQAAWQQHPASDMRVYHPGGCPDRAQTTSLEGA